MTLIGTPSSQSSEARPIVRTLFESNTALSRPLLQPLFAPPNRGLAGRKSPIHCPFLLPRPVKELPSGQGQACILTARRSCCTRQVGFAYLKQCIRRAPCA